METNKGKFDIREYSAKVVFSVRMTLEATKTHWIQVRTGEALSSRGGQAYFFIFCRRWLF